MEVTGSIQNPSYRLMESKRKMTQLAFPSARRQLCQRSLHPAVVLMEANSVDFQIRFQKLL